MSVVGQSEQISTPPVYTVCSTLLVKVVCLRTSHSHRGFSPVVDGHPLIFVTVLTVIIYLTDQKGAKAVKRLLGF
jgi:hypothetical protein